MKSSSEGLVAVAVVIVLSVGALLFGSCAVVPPGHRGVSVVLGKVGEHQYAEGLTLKWPLIETIEKTNIQQTTYEDSAECFSSDLQTVTVKYNVLMRIPEKSVVELFRGYRGDIFESLVRPRVHECLKQASAESRAQDLVKMREKLKAAAIQKVRKDVGDILDIVDITITNIDLTDELEKAIEAKVKMEQLALAKRFELQREETEAEITIVKATAEAESVRVRGEAIKASPGVIDLEIVKRWNGVSPTTVVTGAGGASVVLPIK